MQIRDKINAAFVVRGTWEECKEIEGLIETLFHTELIYHRKGLPHEKLFIHKEGECDNGGGRE